MSAVDRQEGTPGGKIAPFPTAPTHPLQSPLKSSGVSADIFPRKISGQQEEAMNGIHTRMAMAGLLSLGGMSAAFAEDAPKPPDFVPFVVDQQQDQAARTYLNGLTFKDAAPLVAWLNELEARAKGQWQADHAPKGEAKP